VKPDIIVEPVSPVQATPKEMDIAPVYFAFDNFILSADGIKQLEQLTRLMKDYPEVRLKLVGHADAKGTAEYNLKLSEKRARVTLNYLVKNGISESRLTAIGLGEKNFVAVNSNPDGTDNPNGRQLNRRVEYEIVGSGDILMVIKLPVIPESLKFRK
jgi:OOP family OmpA-OmpF porin